MMRESDTFKEKFRCFDCGKYFDDPKAVEEDRGEFWGIPCTETVYYCPYCMGEFDDADVVDKALEEEG